MNPVFAEGGEELVPQKVAKQNTISQKNQDIPLHELSHKAILPAGELMPLGFYSLEKSDLQRAKDAGCTFVGPYYGIGSSYQQKQLSCLEAASNAGLQFLYSVGPIDTLTLAR